jgi:hypothetical protein
VNACPPAWGAALWLDEISLHAAHQGQCLLGLLSFGMFSIEVGGRKLTVAPDAISYGDRRLEIAAIQSLSVNRIDQYVDGAWVWGDRAIRVSTTDDMIAIDCSQALPNREALEQEFERAFDPIWSSVASQLVNRFLDRLRQGETTSIAGISVSPWGIWVDGAWKILWLKARPQLVSWPDIEISSADGSLFLASLRDRQVRSELKINDTENALILDALVRFLLVDDNWRSLPQRA